MVEYGVEMLDRIVEAAKGDGRTTLPPQKAADHFGDGRFVLV